MVGGRPATRHGRTFPSGRPGHWDANWVRSTIHVRTGGFTADVSADLRTDELHRFTDGLAALDGSPSGSAVLRSMEDWIDLTVTLQPDGSCIASGAVKDGLGLGNRLTFALRDLDQTHLSVWLEQMGAVRSAFPVLGRPWAGALDGARCAQGLAPTRRSISSGVGRGRPFSTKLRCRVLTSARPDSSS